MSAAARGCDRARAGAVLASALLLAGGGTMAAPAASASAAPASAAAAVAALPPDHAPGLRHDPFRRPRFGPDGAIVREAAEEREGKTRLADAPPAWQPELRGVMLAGPDSIANVEGTIVRIGEAIDGWRLVRVADGQAWFAKSGRQATLTMNNAGPARR